MPADAASIGVLALAFAAGVLATLALPALRRALRRHALRTDARQTAAREASGATCLAPAIGAAVRSGELQLHYQPKIDCRTLKICGAEALSRWTLPDGTKLQPEEFVAQAEALGGIAELTVWGVKQALRDSSRLAPGSLGGPIFVNLSGRLITTGFAAQLIDVIGDRSGDIGFEITETAVLENPQEALECLHALREAGIALAIDDYGAGLSSLSYLKQIPAGELKIDRKFIQGMTRSNRDPLIVRSTIDLCHGLGMTVTAEGVEDAMTASLLRVMGCDTIQGYYVSKAVGIDALIQFIAAHPSAEPQVPQIRKIVNHAGRD
jgi:EAL domain-containing protein (putative c-di-GMP-specific phosphodiesterase class I)